MEIAEGGEKERERHKFKNTKVPPLCYLIHFHDRPGTWKKGRKFESFSLGTDYKRLISQHGVRSPSHCSRVNFLPHVSLFAPR